MTTTLPIEQMAVRWTGRSTVTPNRTLDQDMSDLCYNVKDFGAIGNGSADDTTSVQAAIDAALVSGGEVFFPQGQYKIISTLVTTAGTSDVHVRLRGVGATNINTPPIGSMIIGSLAASYLIDTTSGSGGGKQTVDLIEGISFQNTNSTGNGVKIGSGISVVMRNCFISVAGSGIGLYFFANGSIEDSGIIGNSTVGSKGIISFQNSITGCSITNWDTAMQCQNSGLVIRGTRFENNNLAIWLGVDESGADSAMSGADISGNTFEANNTGVLAAHIAGLAFVGNMVTGTTGVFGEATVKYGIRIANTTGTIFAGVTVAGTFTLGGVFFDQTPVTTAFVGVNSGGGSAVPWVLPSAGWNNTNDQPIFINCNNPTPAQTFSHITTSPVEGMQFSITDGQKSTTGAAAFGDIVIGGSTGHYAIRYNGTNWTRCG